MLLDTVQGLSLKARRKETVVSSPLGRRRGHAADNLRMTHFQVRREGKCSNNFVHQECGRFFVLRSCMLTVRLDHDLILKR